MAEQHPRESERLIASATRGNYGLAPARWTRQLEEIRNLPEVKKP